MTNLAYVFPGQGSQSVGMMSAWEEHQSSVIEIFSEASDALGYDLWALVGNGPEARLNETEVTQPAMLCAGVASWRIASQQIDMPTVPDAITRTCAMAMQLTFIDHFTKRRRVQ